MPFDPDELANGMQRWLEQVRKPKPAPKDAKPLPEPEYGFVNPDPSPPPAEMPGSGPSIQELQEQIKALQEQLKEINGNADVPMAPRDRTPEEPHYPLGPGRNAPKFTPDERRKIDWEMFEKWRQGSNGVPDYAYPRDDIDPGFSIPADPNAPDIDPYFSIPTDPNAPDIDPGFKADMTSWGPYGQPGATYDVIKPNPLGELAPRDYIQQQGSPVKDLNKSYTPSKVTPGKGASLN